MCALWKIRELYPEPDGNYVMYVERNKINFIDFEYYTDYPFFVLILDKCRKYIQLKNENLPSKS